MTDRVHRVAVIPGDGIGQEVVPAARTVIDAVGQRLNFSCVWTDFDWSCELHAASGSMTGDGSIEELAEHDAIFLGAIGYPGVADHVSLWGLLIPIRRRFAQYVNLRPVRLLPGVRTPLADRGPRLGRSRLGLFLPDGPLQYATGQCQRDHAVAAAGGDAGCSHVFQRTAGLEAHDRDPCRALRCAFDRAAGD